MLAHYTAIARQHKNALSAVGRLPEELLAMIFAYAQYPSRPSGTHYYPDGWIPSRRIVNVELPGGDVAAGEEKKTERVVRYQLGWIVLTHVCSAWRTVRAHCLYILVNCNDS
ncbi:hypothetical protein PENSPDRAFT_56604 [Peniophora sp. CONT]|nr:hypothetical protein PENSPDRAFT_56604 [Peniophora sp. CONT]